MRTMKVLCLLLPAVLLLALFSCSSAATEELAPQDLFEVLDTDHDGRISPSEFTDGVKGIRQKANTLERLNKNVIKGKEDTLSFTSAFTSSTAMIIATEIGDKTFFIAAVLSMSKPRVAVFSGAILALICMTILSTMIGVVLPSVMPRKYTHIIGGMLFLYFGLKLIYDSREMESNKVSDELEEVEEELLKTRKKDEDEDNNIELGDSSDKSKKSERNRPSSGVSPVNVFIQSLTLTFLAEWGDRSQIATIALAAAKDPLGVTVGGCFGHSLCTGMAVIGGRMLASRISEKTVHFWGGFVFLLFGVHSLFFES